MTDAPLTLAAFRDLLSAFEHDAAPAIAATDSAEALEAVRAKFLGRTHGWLKDLSAKLGQLPKEDRAAAGATFNDVRQRVDEMLSARQFALAPRRAAGAIADPTMPARRTWTGAVHPVTAVIDEICDVFRELGFTIALGPEAESEWYNFSGLNFPADHPAMELHDTLYLDGGGLLRTHTSPVQLRTLQRHPPPIRTLAPGNVFRRDFFDATHAPMFAQLEGLAVDEGISFADLKATLSHFARRIYGKTRRTRFGPSYFPFTEPSAQMDVEVDLGDGKGLRWMEIMGCGLVHPAVLESAGVDSETYTGWAFGMGPARIALSRHGIPDLRHFYDGDVRFLEQFAR